MRVLSLIRSRFAPVLATWLTEPDALNAALERIVASREAGLADYQANVAMPLQKKLGKPPLAIAEEIVAKVDLSDICESVTIAGQGYVNLRAVAQMARQMLDGSPCRSRTFGRGSCCRPKDLRYRLFFSKRGQTDARRPHPFDRHR